MRHEPASKVSWWRRVAVMGVAVAGLVAIVGSGGGGDAPQCSFFWSAATSRSGDDVALAGAGAEALAAAGARPTEAASFTPTRRGSGVSCLLQALAMTLHAISIPVVRPAPNTP